MGKGNPERAAELKREFEKGFDGIMKRVWPYLERVEAIDSVGIKGQLENSYVKGEERSNVHLGYSSSEMLLQFSHYHDRVTIPTVDG